MPTAIVQLTNGQEWFVSQSEIVIPARQSAQMSAQEIGEAVLALIPRIRRLAPYVNEWASLAASSPERLTLEDLERHVDKLESIARRRQAAAPYIQARRQEVQSNYDHIFVAIGRRDGFYCVVCGISADLEIDHIAPLALGGSNGIENLQLLCKSCNCKKGDRE